MLQTFWLKQVQNITLLHAEILDVQSLVAVHILLDLLILTFLPDKFWLMQMLKSKYTQELYYFFDNIWVTSKKTE